MSNRIATANTDIRTPLLYALAVEHKRALVARNTQRVQEIAVIQLAGLGCRVQPTA
jgi:hypothetical protein